MTRGFFMKKINFLTTVIVFLIAIWLPVLVRAQDALPNLRLQIMPTVVRLDLEPGEIYQGSFKVINSGRSTFDYRVYVKPYQVNNEDYDPNFEIEVPRTQITNWINVATTSGTLASMETEVVEYIIRVPREVPDGGQYAVIFVETGEADGTSALSVRQRLGYLVFSSMAGTTRDEGQLLETKMKRFWADSPVYTTSLIENSGNADFVVNYAMHAKDIFGREKFSLDREYTLLPETKRLVKLEWPEAPVFGIFSLTQSQEFLDQDYSQSKMILIMHPVIMTALVSVLVVVALVAVITKLTGRRRKEKRRLDKNEHYVQKSSSF